VFPLQSPLLALLSQLPPALSYEALLSFLVQSDLTFGLFGLEGAEQILSLHNHPVWFPNHLVSVSLPETEVLISVSWRVFVDPTLKGAAVPRGI